MKHKRFLCLLTLLAVLLLLTACTGRETVSTGSAATAEPIPSEQSTPPESTAQAEPIQAEEDFYLIDPAELTETMRLYNYDVDGSTVQILALRDSAGAVHVAFNTCQSCSPSPKAYYLQEDGKLICQNCKFAFTAEEVGLTKGGCNPWPIDDIQITQTEIRIPKASVDAMGSVFQNWAGPKE